MSAAKPRAKIVIGDSRDMGEVPDCSVHLVVTSPPYPMIEMWDSLFSGLDRRIGGKIKASTEIAAREAYFLMHRCISKSIAECSRALTTGGICCINIGDATRTVGGKFQVFPNHATIMETMAAAGLTTLPYVLWKKPTNRPNAFLGSGFLPTNAYVTLDCEYILIGRKGGPRKFEPKDPLRYGSSFTKEDRDRWFSQLWSDIPGADQKSENGSGRSGAFPIEIPRRLIRMYSIKGDTILDPFMGTGTTLRASRECGRNFVGYEIDENAISPVVKKLSGVTIVRRSR